MNIDLNDYAIPDDMDLTEWEVQTDDGYDGATLFVRNVGTGKQKAFLHRDAMKNDPRELETR